MTEKPERERFDRVAEVYDETIPAHVRDHYARKRARLVSALVRGGLVLDVGAGTGLLGAELARHGHRVVGVEPSAGMLGELRRRGRASRVQAVQGLGEGLPFRTGVFDLAICAAVLHHVADPGRVAATVREMVRVTAPGGWVVLWDHNPRNPYWPIIMKRVPQDDGDERLIPLRELLEAVGVREVAEVRLRHAGFVPDFAPPWALPLFVLLERLVESSPLGRWLAAHNVVVARKRG